MDNELSDELILRAQNGDMEAFEKIYRLTSGFVFNVALRIAHQHADAEDITQEVYVKMHNNLGGFGFKSSIKTWLYRITVNAALSRCRKKTGEANFIGRYKNQLAAEADGNVSPVPGREMDDEAIVAGMLARLDPDQRTCIVLREMEGLTYNEIADILNIPMNTVRSRLYRARETLMEFTKKEEALI